MEKTILDYMPASYASVPWVTDKTIVEEDAVIHVLVDSSKRTRDLGVVICDTSGAVAFSVVLGHGYNAFTYTEFDIEFAKRVLSRFRVGIDENDIDFFGSISILMMLGYECSVGLISLVRLFLISIAGLATLPFSPFAFSAIIGRLSKNFRYQNALGTMRKHVDKIVAERKTTLERKSKQDAAVEQAKAVAFLTSGPKVANELPLPAAFDKQASTVQSTRI